MEAMIYMPLVGEGTDCWRPVRAVQVAPDIFEVVDHIPAGESWAFAPGARLRCREHVLSSGEPGLEAFEYAIESDPHYQLLKKHERKLFRVIFADGEESVVRVLHVNGEYEDFIYDLVSTKADRDHYREHRDTAFVARFTDLVFAELQE
jgi:hypothetical protein